MSLGGIRKYSERREESEKRGMLGGYMVEFGLCDQSLDHVRIESQSPLPQIDLIL